jgi:hypothetical protein
MSDDDKKINSTPEELLEYLRPYTQISTIDGKLTGAVRGKNVGLSRRKIGEITQWKPAGVAFELVKRKKGQPRKGSLLSQLFRSTFSNGSTWARKNRPPVSRKKPLKKGEPNRLLVREAVEGCIANGLKPTGLNVLEWIWVNKDEKKELSSSYLALLINAAKRNLKL